MKKLIIYLILLFINISNSQSFKQFWNSLYIQKCDSVFLIKELKGNSYFQGYDFIDSMRVFIAYQKEGYSEAVTVLSIYNIEVKSEMVLGELGLTGESTFSYNIENELILFNLDDGIYVLKIEEAINKDLRPKLIYECDNCYLPFWINSNTICYFYYSDGKKMQKYIQLDPLIKK